MLHLISTFHKTKIVMIYVFIVRVCLETMLYKCFNFQNILKLHGVSICRASSLNRDTFTGACSLLKCWKKSVYQDIVVKSDETSTYQELDITESAYQNTTIRWKTHNIFLFRIYSNIFYASNMPLNTTAIKMKIQIFGVNKIKKQLSDSYILHKMHHSQITNTVSYHLVNIVTMIRYASVKKHKQ